MGAIHFPLEALLHDGKTLLGFGSSHYLQHALTVACPYILGNIGVFLAVNLCSRKGHHDLAWKSLTLLFLNIVPFLAFQ